jgi:fibro-slime domain-containing protein
MKAEFFVLPVFSVVAAALIAGCGGGAGESSSGFGPQGGAGGSSSSSGSQGEGGTLFSGGGLTTSGPSTGSGSVPMNFKAADIGAYALGAAITGDGSTDTGLDSSDGCGTLVGVVRDFKGVNEPGGHPDFEAFQGDHATPGLVQSTLGGDDKPVYAGNCDASNGGGNCPYGQQMNSKADFDEWYRYVPGADKPYLVYLQFVEDKNTHISTFKSSLFFPLDGAGFGDSGKGTDGKPHDFGFTTEIHTKFQYNGGEKFTFTGDDDLWVFINKKLAIDLGGLHPPETATVDLDQAAGMLGIEKGTIYALDLFHAERHTEGSNFRVDTNLGFVDCGTIPPDPK